MNSDRGAAPMKTGRVFKFGDHIDTDALAPGAYMKNPVAELAGHCLETVRAEFARTAQSGNVIMAGRNFGMGSSREQAAEVLKHLGIAAVCAVSFGGIFYRNALNLGLPVFVLDEAAIETFADGEAVTFDLDANALHRIDRDESVALPALPGFLLEMLRDGGLLPHLEKRFQDQKG